MTKTTKDQKLAELNEGLQYFTGDLERFRHSLNRKVLFTPGVHFLAEKADAYWLIDAIASWVGSPEFNSACEADYRIGEMHFWTLDVADDQSALLYAKADRPCDAFIEQQIEWTDFPLPKVDIWGGFDGEHWTLYLPSEH